MNRCDIVDVVESVTSELENIKQQIVMVNCNQGPIPNQLSNLKNHAQFLDNIVYEHI